MTIVTTQIIGCWTVVVLVGVLTGGLVLLGMRRWLKNQRQELMTTVEQLRDVDRLTTQRKVTADIAHLLGTPLNVISGRAKMIASGENAAEHARVIEAQTERVTQALHALLGEARQVSTEAPYCAIDPLFKQTKALLDPIAQRAHLRLAVAPPSSLAVAIAPHEALTMLTQLVKTMMARRDRGRVALAATREQVAVPPDRRAAPGSYVCIQITTDNADRAVSRSDSGPEPAARTTLRETALGLSVCQHIVEEQGGWIDVTDELGYGDVLSVYLCESRTTED